MKKPIIITLGALVVIAAGGYTGSVWYFGKKAQDVSDEMYRRVTEAPNPFIKITQRDYQRGLFSATETLRLEINIPAGSKTVKDALEPEGLAKPLVIAFRSTIKHGPLIGTELALASSLTEVVSAESSPEFMKLFGDKPPLELHSKLLMDGSGTAKLSSPALTYNKPATEGGATTVVWGGAGMDMSFTKGLAQFSAKLTLPKLEVTDGDGNLLAFNGFSYVADGKRAFDDVSNFYSGSAKVALQSLEAKYPNQQATALQIQNIRLDADTPISGEFMDFVMKSSAESLELGSQKYSDINYDISLKHLHARTFVSLIQVMEKSQASLLAANEKDPEAYTAASKALVAQLGAPSLELMKNDPVLSIDRIGFHSEYGDALLSANAKLLNATPETFNNVALLIGSLNLNVDLSFPVALVDVSSAIVTPGSAITDPAIAEAAPEAATPTDAAAATPADASAVIMPSAPPVASAAVPQVQTTPPTDSATPEATASASVPLVSEKMARINALIEKGLLVQEGEMIKTKIVFANGALIINEKTINPFALGSMF